MARPPSGMPSERSALWDFFAPLASQGFSVGGHLQLHSPQTDRHALYTYPVHPAYLEVPGYAPPKGHGSFRPSPIKIKPGGFPQQLTRTRSPPPRSGLRRKQKKKKRNLPSSPPILSPPLPNLLLSLPPVVDKPGSPLGERDHEVEGNSYPPPPKKSCPPPSTVASEQFPAESRSPNGAPPPPYLVPLPPVTGAASPPLPGSELATSLPAPPGTALRPPWKETENTIPRSLILPAMCTIRKSTRS